MPIQQGSVQSSTYIAATNLEDGCSAPMTRAVSTSITVSAHRISVSEISLRISRIRLKLLITPCRSYPMPALVPSRCARAFRVSLQQYHARRDRVTSGNRLVENDSRSALWRFVVQIPHGRLARRNSICQYQVAKCDFSGEYHHLIHSPFGECD